MAIRIELSDDRIHIQLSDIVRLTKRYDGLVKDKLELTEISWSSIGAVGVDLADRFSTQVENAVAIARELDRAIDSKEMFGRVVLSKKGGQRVSVRGHERSRDGKPFIHILAPSDGWYVGEFLDIEEDYNAQEK